MSKPLTIKEIRARFNKDKPKFIGLKNDREQWPVPINSPQIKAEQRMKQIEAFFAKDSTPDGIYFFVEKDSLQRNAPETITQVAKGDIRNLPAVAEPPRVSIQQSATKDVWDLKTALDKETTIISLTMRNAYLEAENEELKKQLKELEESIPLEDEDGKKSESKELMEGFKSIMETVTPVIDKHFELKDRELKLKEKAGLNGHAPGRRMLVRETVQSATERNDGGVPADDPGYEEYFADVVERGTDEQLDHECNYLEQVNPELYQQFVIKYQIEDSEEEEKDNGERS